MDAVDEAQRYQDLAREEALQNALSRNQGEQLIVEGIVFCHTCHLPLSEARLQAMPTATHCVDCQNIEEKQQGKRHGGG
ncbi:MAG: TraR/DksA family transcriptional regulator [Gammaproteobacteria bacterium]|nr:TraR/DksA family transcriptional regulator [Gammaproteobacteria bacterium]